MVIPLTQTITHIDIKSQKEIHAINNAELTAITVALKHKNTIDHLKIHTQSSFYMNTIRNYTIYPASYKLHLHKDLLHLPDQLERARDTKQLQTHIGEVKSHTDIEYNEAADTAARAVVDGEVPPCSTFDEADPPIGGLRTWPLIRHTSPDKLDTTKKITNLKTGIKMAIKETTPNITRGVFGALLKQAIDTGTNFSIQAHSQSPYRCRRDSYEVAWGTHVYCCKRKHIT